MSVAQEATEIEQHAAYLSSELDGEPPYTIHGIAIGEGDVTRGSSGIEKKWPREALKPAAETLAGRPLVVDHENDSHAVVGKVTEAFYKEGTGVLYEAELFDEELADKIADGLLEVSIRGFHGDVSEMNESEEGAKVVEKLRFDNLSIVPMGAAPSNTVEIGPVDEMDGDELTGERCAALIESAELSHAAPDENSFEQPSVKENFNSASLTGNFNEDDLVMWEWSGGEAHGRVMNVFTEAGKEITRTIDGNEVTRTVEENRPVYELEVWREDDKEFSGTALKYHDKLNKWSDVPEMVEEASMHGATPQWEEGKLVRWQVEPDLFGKIVHVDSERHIVMVEVHDRVDGELQSTGFTISAGYSDLMPMEMGDTEENTDTLYSQSLREHSARLGDGYVPTLSEGLLEEMSEAQLQEKLDEVYSEWNDHVNMSASELRQWSKNPCSREASVDPQAVIKRNLRLLKKDKDDWTKNDIQDAERTISFISRMSAEENKPESPKDGTNGCPTDWAISLLNWAYNPFDSMPNIPDEMDSLEAVELARDPHEGAEFERHTDTDRYSKDISRYPEGDNTPPEDSEGMHEDEKSDELASYGLHAPEYEGTTMESSGDGRVRMEDFSTDDLGEIAEHFLISDSGFPPDRFKDLKLPVVTTTGELSLPKLRAAKRSVGAVDGLDANLVVDVVMMINRLIMSEFPNEPLALRSGGTMAQEEELQGTSIHEPEFSDTTTGSWDKPALEDFTDNSWDDLSQEMKSEISTHYIVSKSGDFPPEDFGDLALPVVEPNGNLNLSALQSAKARAGQVGNVSTSDEEEINNIINRLAENNFDANFSEDEESEDAAEHPIDVVRETRTAFEFADGRIVSVAGDEAEELRAAEEQTGGTEQEMTSNDDARDNEEAEAEAGEGSEPDANASTSSEQGDSNMTETVEIDKDELENLRAQAEKAEEREEELEELREGFSEDLAELKDRTAVLEDADRELVEELTDGDDPIVVESERFEELERHVDEVRDAYADELASHVGMDAETLAEKFSVDELRGQLEEQIDEDEEVEEELTPDPKSEDPESEEELEEASGEAEEEEELAEEAQEKQEELRAKMGLN